MTKTFEFKPIPVQHKNNNFRSKTELRWASFFDMMNIEWEYEPKRFSLPSGSYLPDFWLPNVSGRAGKDGVWAEIKGSGPALEEADLCRELAQETGLDCVLLVGTPWDHYIENDTARSLQFFDGWEDNCPSLYFCEPCVKYKFDFGNARKTNCHCCGKDTSDPIYVHEATLPSFLTASLLN